MAGLAGCLEASGNRVRNEPDLIGLDLTRQSLLGVFGPPWQIQGMSAADTFAYLDARPERPGDEVLADRFRLMAAKIEANPLLLSIPLENVERWLAKGHSAVERLTEWRAVLIEATVSEAGLAKLLELLRDQSAEAVFFKEFAPMPGILTREELDRLSWTSAH